MQESKPKSKFAEGWILFKSSLLFIFKKPVFLIPIFLCWIVVASITLYLRYWWNPAPAFVFLESFLFIFLIAYVICLTNLILLQLIKQLEESDKTSLLKALKETITLDAIKVIPLAVFFALIWFVIVILRALTSRKSNDKAQPSLEDAAMTLGGMNTPFNWIRLGLDMFEKLIRMVVFLALPAIAWENQGSLSAFKRSIQIIRKHPIQFLTAYGLTEVAAIIMGLPLIPFYLASKAHVYLPDSIWLGVIIYEGIIWTLSIYLEQMSVAFLYLWHMKWMKNGSIGNITDVMKPNLLEDFHNLRNIFEK